MAEALGVAAAAAQFAGLSIKIVKTAKAIHDKLDAPSEIQERLHEVEDLQKLVSEVKRYPELQNPDTASILESCVKISDKLCRTLDDVNVSAEDPLGQRTWKAIVGSMKEEEINALFSRLDTAKSTLAAKIGLETFNRQRSMVTEIKRLRFSGPADEDACLRALFQTDPARDRDGILSAKGDMTTGTCTWITSTEEYKQWDTTAPHLLWISAPPGMGKTYLSIYLSTHFEGLARDSIDVATIFFFCDDKAQFRNTAFDVLRGLIYQLIQRQNNLVHILLGCWKIQRDSIFEGHSLETLWKVFHDIIKAIRATTIYCVLDALDECEQPSLSVLLRKLAQLATSDGPASKIKLIALSRRAPAQLAESFSSFTELQIDQKQGMKDDVERFISVEVLKLARKKQIVDMPLHRHIEETFRQKSENTFLWLSFMARALESQSLASIEASLEDLPRGLDAVYDRILSQIEPGKMEVISKILNWLILAPVHFRIANLCEVVGIKPTTKLRREEVCLDYIKCCGHLLQTTLITDVGEDDSTEMGDDVDFESCIQRDQPLPLSDDVETDVESLPDNAGGSDGPSLPPYYWRLEVTFLHQSAKDYLLKPGSRFKPYLVPTQEMHEAISDHLIGYLCHTYRPTEVEPLGRHESLLQTYACLFWSFHFEKVDDVSGLIGRHKDFFEKRAVIKAHHKMMLPDGVRAKAANSGAPPILFMATALELYNLATWYLQGTKTLRLLRPRKSIDETWGHLDETSLQLACRLGNVRFVKLLVDAGADLNPKTNRQNEPLHTAAQTGRMDVFQILLATKQGEKLVDPKKARGSRHEKLLQSAVLGGNEDVCRLLIEKYHWDVEGLADPERPTPLEFAVANGNVDLAGILVSRWHAKTNNHARLLIRTNEIEEAGAFRNMINLLVRGWSVDPNTAINTTGCNILCSYIGGSPRIMFTKLSTLIALGVHPTQRDSDGKSLLHCASKHFQFSYLVVKTQLLEYLLRDGRLHINEQDNDGRTILTQAVSRMLYFVGNGSEKAACGKYLKYGPPALRRLLDLGVDRFVGRDHKTVLTVAMKLSIVEGRRNLDEAEFSMYQRVIRRAMDVLDNYSTVPVDLARVQSGTEKEPAA